MMVMGEKRIKIAIDGPAASGKSTTARSVARKLDYQYIDSGAMYRAVTLKALRMNIPVDDFPEVAEVANKISIEFNQNNSRTEVLMDGEDVSEAIRTPSVTNNIGPVAANPRVRETLVEKQRALGKEGGVVMDGRDITTVVFPDAELKVMIPTGSLGNMAPFGPKWEELTGIPFMMKWFYGRYGDRLDAAAPGSARRRNARLYPAVTARCDHHA